MVNTVNSEILKVISSPPEEYVLLVSSIKPVHTTVFCENFTVFDCWGYFMLRQFQNQFCACLARSGQKCEWRLLFNTNIPTLLPDGYCIIMRGADISYRECLNKDNYVTVWFIVGINTDIVPQNQYCQVIIVEGAVLQWTSVKYL